MKNDEILVHNGGGAKIDTTNGVHLGCCAYDGVYSDEQYQWLAEHFDVIILHENHNDKIDFIKSVNPDVILLCYRFCGVDRSKNIGCGSFHWIDKNHPEWFLLDKDGSRITDYFNEYSKRNVYLMDFRNSGWRHYLAQDIVQTAKIQGWDGIFLDGMHVNIGDYWAPNGIRGYKNNREFNKAVKGFLSTIYPYFKESNKLLIPNACECIKVKDSWEAWLNFSDGGVDEGFSSISNWSPADIWRNPGEWMSQILYMEYTGDQDKLFYAYSQGRWLNERDLLYNLASYLIGKRGGKDVFCNGAGGCSYSKIKRDYDAFKDFYNAPIGTPLGERYKSQGVWQRDYSNGRVLVNPSSEGYHVELGKVYRTVNNITLTSLTLGNHEGMILLNY
ncbi:MAG: putative glycoside hydrolase [Candidatus Altiarchaeota archaeon]|nr:putative glycoside hydrolase [Candidatus Altiarchaeota archaeon]